MLAARDATAEKTARRVDARSIPFAAALEAWLLRFARTEAKRVAAAAGIDAIEKAASVEKADADEAMRRELAELIRRFGVRQAADAANNVAGGVVAPTTLIDDVLRGKDTRIRVFQELAGWSERTATRITQATRVEVRENVRDIVREGRADGQSAGEIARRIRTQLHGPDPAKRIYAFSPERAALIARTELVQAENAGIVEGYRATGIEEIEWLAYRDGRSGDRHHERMHGKRVRLGEYFTLPSGARLRFPGDPDGPISEVANCRCTTRPVRARPRPGAPPPPAPPPAPAPAPPPAPAAPPAPPPRPDPGTWAADPGLSGWAPPEYSDPQNVGSAPTGNLDEAELARALQTIRPGWIVRPSDQVAVRRQLRESLARYGLVSTDIARAGGAGAKEMEADSRNLPSNALATHDWTGRVRLSADASAALAAYGRGDRGPEAQAGIHTAVHEEVHGHGPAIANAYDGFGKWIEEGTTEIVARQVVREQFVPGARLSPMDAGPIATLPSGLMTRVGAYQQVLTAIYDSVGLVFPTLGGRKRLEDVLERAAFRYRNLTKVIMWKEEALDSFVDAIIADPALQPLVRGSGSTRSQLRDTLKRKLEAIV